MASYRLAGRDLSFTDTIPELQQLAAQVPVPLRIPVTVDESGSVLTSRTTGIAGGEKRHIERWDGPAGVLLKIERGPDVRISSCGNSIARVSRGVEAGGDDGGSTTRPLEPFDVEILLGPALVLALAMQGTFCLHASAVLHRGRVIALAGDSGHGKSTIAAFLSSGDRSGPRLVADDILPVTVGVTDAFAWPRFPQLKLPSDSQPGASLPESIPLDRIFVLAEAKPEEPPALQLLAPGDAVRMLLRHTAGTRLFDRALLETHLSFCADVATKLRVFRILYPHRRDALPEVAELLETSR